MPCPYHQIMLIIHCLNGPQNQITVTNLEEHDACYNDGILDTLNIYF